MTDISAMSATQSGELTVRALTPADAPAMQRLFEDVFKHEMTDALYAWKYRPQYSAAIGVFRAGELVAHYAGMGADIMLQGHPERAIQVVDVMVSPAVRTAVRSQSPFFLAASSFLQQFVGYDKPWLLGYGFPNHRTMQLAEHLKLYAPVGSISELTMPRGLAPRLQDSRWKWRELTTANLPHHAAEIDTLWQQLLDGLPEAIIVRRNAARIAYRYLQHPHHQYHVWLLQSRGLGRSKAVVVMKREAERVLLMDMVAPLHMFPELLHMAAVAAGAQFALPLVAWFSTSHVVAVAPQNATVKPLPISTPANIWSNGPAPAELQDRWWLMAGDTDFL